MRPPNVRLLANEGDNVFFATLLQGIVITALKEHYFNKCCKAHDLNSQQWFYSRSLDLSVEFLEATNGLGWEWRD